MIRLSESLYSENTANRSESLPFFPEFCRVNLSCFFITMIYHFTQLARYLEAIGQINLFYGAII